MEHISESDLTVSPATNMICAENIALLDKCDVEHGSGYERLVVKQNICYIVVGIVINECNQVLMVQEAKPSCYGKWYLPAGRMEPNETISNAVGGKLKTTEEADAESLQAMWWNVDDEIPIRCKDIMPLINMGLEWKTNVNRPENLLPIEQGQSQLFMRVMIVHIQDDDNYRVLLRQGSNHESGKSYLVPTTRIHPHDRSFYTAIEYLLHDAVITNEKNDLVAQLKILGVLSIEHSGKSDLDRDGLAVSVIVDIATDTLPTCCDSYCWLAKDNIPNMSLRTLLNKSISSGAYIPLRSLREKSR